MEKFFNGVSVIGSLFGGIAAYVFGAWDALLIALVSLVVFDFVSGLIKAGYTKVLSSEVGFKGILKKVSILVVVGVANIIQSMLGGATPLREIVLVFFITNEGLSILENLSLLIPIPEALKSMLLQIRDKNEDKEDIE